MKKIVFILIILLFAGNVFAASSMVASRDKDTTNSSVVVIKVVATAHTDGTFDSKQITAAEFGGSEYWRQGYRLIDAFAVNSVTDDHTNAAVVTITDETGRQLVGTTAGDTLSLSQTASGIAYLSIDRGSGQRAVTSKLTIAIADTGSTATVQTLYLVFSK